MTIERDSNGYFAKGNRGGPGNPHVKKIATLRRALFAAATAADVRRIVRKMIGQAAEGDVDAARLVLDRLCGKISTFTEVDEASGERLTTPPGFIPEFTAEVMEAELKAMRQLQALAARQQTRLPTASPPGAPSRTPATRGREGE
jgi:hypothetical protein